jgi:EXS family
MDWGMMKNPSVAATALCKFPMHMSSNGNGQYFSVPTRDSVGDIRSPLGRNPSGAVLTPATSAAGATASIGSCWHALLRNRLRFGVGISVLILVTDIVLRFSWTLRFYHKLFPSPDAFVLCTQFLEVFRRALWNLLRVEWENLKQSGQHHLSSNGHLGHNSKTSGSKVIIPISSSIQLTSLNNISDDETAGFIKGNTSLGKLTNIGKKTVGK